MVDVEVSEWCDQIMQEMAEGLKNHSFSDGWFMKLSPEQRTKNHRAALSLLKIKGWVECLNLNQSHWGLTSAGRQAAMRLLGV